MDELHKQHIKDSFAATKERRKGQIPLLVDTKVNYRRCSGLQKDFLKMSFIELKRTYNYLLDLTRYVSNNIIHTDDELKFLESIGESIADEETQERLKISKARPADYKTVGCYIYDKEQKKQVYQFYETRYIGSKWRQACVDQLKSSIKGLHTLKEHGRKVGSLKFKSEVNSVVLKEQGIGFNLNIGTSDVRIQGCKEKFKLHGIKQFKYIKDIDPDYELASCQFVKKGDKDYHCKFIVYVNAEKYITYKKKEAAEKLQHKKRASKDVPVEGDIAAIDFGCMTSFTMNDGQKINLYVEETERLKSLQRALQRCEDGSNNKYKLRKEIRKEYAKMGRQKDEIAIKFVNYLASNFSRVIIQDEQLSNWMKTGHGKAVQHSVLGRVKKLLMNHRWLPVTVLNKFIPTTKFCQHCGYKHNALTQSDRVYECPRCHSVSDRDTHSAELMLWIYKMCVEKNIVPRDAAVITRAEFDKLVSMVFGSNVIRVEERELERCDNASQQMHEDGNVKRPSLKLL